MNRLRKEDADIARTLIMARMALSGETGRMATLLTLVFSSSTLCAMRFRKVHVVAETAANVCQSSLADNLFAQG